MEEYIEKWVTYTGSSYIVPGMSYDKHAEQFSPCFAVDKIKMNKQINFNFDFWNKKKLESFKKMVKHKDDSWVENYVSENAIDALMVKGEKSVKKVGIHIPANHEKSVVTSTRYTFHVYLLLLFSEKIEEMDETHLEKYLQDYHNAQYTFVPGSVAKKIKYLYLYRTHGAIGKKHYSAEYGLREFCRFLKDLKVSNLPVHFTYREPYSLYEANSLVISKDTRFDITEEGKKSLVCRESYKTNISVTSSNTNNIPKVHTVENRRRDLDTTRCSAEKGKGHGKVIENSDEGEKAAVAIYGRGRGTIKGRGIGSHRCMCGKDDSPESLSMNSRERSQGDNQDRTTIPYENNKLGSSNLQSKYTSSYSNSRTDTDKKAKCHPDQSKTEISHKDDTGLRKNLKESLERDAYKTKLPNSIKDCSQKHSGEHENHAKQVGGVGYSNQRSTANSDTAEFLSTAVCPAWTSPNPVANQVCSSSHSDPKPVNQKITAENNAPNNETGKEVLRVWESCNDSDQQLQKDVACKKSQNLQGNTNQEHQGYGTFSQNPNGMKENIKLNEKPSDLQKYSDTYKRTSRADINSQNVTHNSRQRKASVNRYDCDTSDAKRVFSSCDTSESKTEKRKTADNNMKADINPTYDKVDSKPSEVSKTSFSYESNVDGHGIKNGNKAEDRNSENQSRLLKGLGCSVNDDMLGNSRRNESTEKKKDKKKKDEKQMKSTLTLPDNTVDDPCGFQCKFYGTADKQTGRVILLLGASGSGKTTLINFIANYYKGKKSVEEELIHVEPTSPTSTITAYTFCDSLDDTPITILDTPGLNDSLGAEIRDHVQTLKTFLANASSKDYKIHAIGFVAQAYLVRLTSSERLVMDYVSTLFGESISDHLITFITFADNQEVPPVVEAMKNYGVRSKHSLKFNNSALTNSKSEETAEIDIDKAYWKICRRNWKKCLKILKDMTPLSVKTMKAVQSEVYSTTVIKSAERDLYAELTSFFTNLKKEAILSRESVNLCNKIWNLAAIVHYHKQMHEAINIAVEDMLVQFALEICKVKNFPPVQYIYFLSLSPIRPLMVSGYEIIRVMVPLYELAKKWHRHYNSMSTNITEWAYCHGCDSNHTMQRYEGSRFFMKRFTGPSADVLALKCTVCKCPGEHHGVSSYKSPFHHHKVLQQTFSSLKEVISRCSLQKFVVPEHVFVKHLKEMFPHEHHEFFEDLTREMS